MQNRQIISFKFILHIYLGHYEFELWQNKSNREFNSSELTRYYTKKKICMYLPLSATFGRIFLHMTLEIFYLKHRYEFSISMACLTGFIFCFAFSQFVLAMICSFLFQDCLSKSIINQHFSMTYQQYQIFFK